MYYKCSDYRVSYNKVIMLITTNDNISALYFSQKRGFDRGRLYRYALDESRKIKPQIPMIGTNGIPIKHEIEFKRLFDLENNEEARGEIK